MKVGNVVVFAKVSTSVGSVRLGIEVHNGWFNNYNSGIFANHPLSTLISAHRT